MSGELKEATLEIINETLEKVAALEKRMADQEYKTNRMGRKKASKAQKQRQLTCPEFTSGGQKFKWAAPTFRTPPSMEIVVAEEANKDKKLRDQLMQEFPSMFVAVVDNPDADEGAGADGGDADET